MPIRWGIVGCGGIVEDQIAEAIQRSDNGRIHAFASRDKSKAESFCVKFGGEKAYEQLEDLLADSDVDAVFIGTPNHLHTRQATQCAAAGKHVLVEKPMALSAVEAQEAIEACESAGVRLMVGYQMRFHPCHQEIHRLVQEDELGDVVTARAQLFFRYSTSPAEWRQQKATAGCWAIGDVGTHAIDLLSWILGDVREVSAILDSPSYGFETEDVAVLTLKFERGTIGIVDCSTGVHSPESKLELYGTKGNILAVGTLGMTCRGNLFIGENTGSGREFTYASTNLYEAEIEEFNQAVVEGRKPAIPGTAGIHAVKIGEAALASSESKTVVAI